MEITTATQVRTAAAAHRQQATERVAATGMGGQEAQAFLADLLACVDTWEAAQLHLLELAATAPAQDQTLCRVELRRAGATRILHLTRLAANGQWSVRVGEIAPTASTGGWMEMRKGGTWMFTDLEEARAKANGLYTQHTADGWTVADVARLAH